MKRFDSEAIAARLLERLRVKTNWALISSDGTIAAVLNTIADGNAELARYMEYLLAEKKWTTAQNISSLLTQADLIGSKPKRKRSATGYVVVSHTDNENVDRLGNYGQTFFNLDERSNYDNISKDPDPQYALRTQALVPWTHSTSYIIPKGTRFVSAQGLEFISTETTAIRSLSMPWDSLKNDATKYTEFLNAGGWNGIKYLKVPVIQGIKKTYTFGAAQSLQFETFLLPVDNCEDASNSISKTFLKFYVDSSAQAGTTVNKEEWVRVPNLLLAGPFDKVYEVVNLPDYSGVLFKVGNGITGKMLPKDATISVEYLETAGASGNLETKYQINSIIFADNANKIDPRTNSATTSFLSTTNISAILGGADQESEEDIRQNAPVEYLKYYAIATTQAYEEQIRAYSQIGLDKVKVYPGSSESMISVTSGSTTISDISTLQNILYVTAISSNGEMIEDPENQFVIPVIKALGDLKAPADLIRYIEPNFIRMRLNAIIYSDAPDISDEEVKAIGKQALLDKYSVFNRNFKEPFYNSDFVSTAQSFSFVNYVTAFAEAVADVNLTKTDTETNPSGVYQYLGSNGYPTLYAIKFKFDKVFGQNLYAQGFANYLQSAPYLLRIDLKIKNDPAKASLKDRTLFLFDERYLYSGTTMPTIEEAKYQMLDGAPVITNGAPTNWLRPDEKVEPSSVTVPGRGSYKIINRAARIAQYPLISTVTDTKAMVAKVKSFSHEPYEIRPWEVDTEGFARLYAIEDLAPEERMLRSPSSGSNIKVTQCYKIDNRFIDYLDITFTENYENPESDAYASGSLIIPANYFEFTNIDVDDPDQFLSALKNFLTLKVYAKPLAEDHFPTEWNEILFAEDDDIIIERVKEATT